MSARNSCSPGTMPPGMAIVEMPSVIPHYPDTDSVRPGRTGAGTRADRPWSAQHSSALSGSPPGTRLRWPRCPMGPAAGMTLGTPGNGIVGLGLSTDLGLQEIINDRVLAGEVEVRSGEHVHATDGDIDGAARRLCRVRGPRPGPDRRWAPSCRVWRVRRVGGPATILVSACSRSRLLPIPTTASSNLRTRSRDERTPSRRPCNSSSNSSIRNCGSTRETSALDSCVMGTRLFWARKAPARHR